MISQDFIVSVRNCQYSVKSGGNCTQILDIPEFKVQKGELTALFGPSGSGKSTFLHIISGLLKASGGQITVAGSELNMLGEVERDRFRARSIGYIFQSFNLLNGLSALENVMLGAALAGKNTGQDQARSLLAEVGLEHRMNNRPHQLSIGEQQRVAVARAIIHAPELILADEPTGSLDPARSMEIIDLLENMVKRHGCTLIAVSHDMNVVNRFPRKVVFADLNKAFTIPEPGKGNDNETA